MLAQALRDEVVDVLEEGKGLDVVVIDVAKSSDVTDFMVVVSGTSNRHVKSLVDRVLENTKAAGAAVLGVEGRETYEWVLLDLGDVIVHAMQKDTRAFYDLERLWQELPNDSGAQTD